MSRTIDLTGQRFGSLVVVSRAENSRQGTAMWLCQCDCGKTTVVRSFLLRKGRTTSCGCQKYAVHTTHGQTHTRLYRIWAAMKNRATNPNSPDYTHYGGRGITICSEWLHDFAAFRDWALSHGYADDLSIDRIDNDKGYSPDNCRWATRKEQDENRRCNHLITYKGETKTLNQWAEQFHIPYGTLHQRLTRYGWSIEKALETPVK